MLLLSHDFQEEYIVCSFKSLYYNFKIFPWYWHHPLQLIFHYIIFRYQKDELNTKDKEIKSLISQVRSLEEELAGLSKSRELTIKENRRIQDDLATMTAENQVLLETRIFFSTSL